MSVSETILNCNIPDSNVSRRGEEGAEGGGGGGGVRGGAEGRAEKGVAGGAEGALTGAVGEEPIVKISKMKRKECRYQSNQLL
jgi:hypothetical protein